jgi:hypothetical protein
MNNQDNGNEELNWRQKKFLKEKSKQRKLEEARDNLTKSLKKAKRDNKELLKNNEKKD